MIAFFDDVMDEMIRTICRSPGTFAGYLLVTALLWTHASAQSKPLAKRSDVWAVHYVVSVTAEFTTEPEPGKDGPSISYHLKRIYTGNAKLTFTSNPAHPQKDDITPLYKDPKAVVHIEIDDFVHSIYTPICGEFETVEAKCKGVGLDSDPTLPVPALLLVDNDQLIYKTSFPVIFISPYNKMRQTGDVDCETQAFDNPGHEANGKPRREGRAFYDYAPPAVEGYIKDGSIQHKLEWSKLKQDGRSLTWMSDILHPDKPLIDGVPDSKDKVNIIISYDITQVGN